MIKVAPEMAAGATARLGRAVYRMRSPWALLQAMLIASCVAGGALWLEIPDTNGAQVATSFVIATIGAAAAVWAQSLLLATVRRGKGRRAKGERLPAWRGALLLVGLGLGYWVVATFFDAGQMQDASRAGSWSLHPRVSELIGVDGLMALQGAMWSGLRWTVAGCLLPFAMEGAATGMRGTWVSRAGRLLRYPLYWGVLLGGAAVGTLVTELLLHLRPQLPVLLEILLTVSKVVVMFALDAGLVCLVLSVTGTYLRDGERRGAGRRRT